MKSPYPLQHNFAGILLCLLGAFLLAGWVTGNSLMVRVVPGSPAVAINTAALFFIAGICLILADSRGLAKRLYRLGVAVLMALPAAVLSQHLLDVNLGIDWASVHAALGDGHTYPGRTAPNACLGFLFAGIVLALGGSEASRRRYRGLCLALSGTTLFIGMFALLGYVLHLEAMYHLASYNRMATLTAIGMSLLGLGLCSLCNAVGGDSHSASGQANRVTRLSATLLTVFAFTAGLTGFAILRPSFEESSHENLRNAARTSAFTISSELKTGVLMSKSVANRSILKRRLERLEAQPKSDVAQQELREVAQMFIESGFSAIHIFDAHDQLAAAEGTLAAEHALLTVPLGEGVTTAAPEAVLVWNDGLLLRAEQAVIQSGRRIGVVVTELPLKDVTDFLLSSEDVGETHEVVLCGRDGEAVACFPSRLNDRVVRHRLPNHKPALSFPVVRALHGEAGSESMTDAHGALVQVAFAPLAEYGLGLAVKKNIKELYEPLRAKLQLLIVSLLAFVAVGTLLFRRWVQPLVEQIVAEQQRIKAILNNSNDAFIAIGSDGRITDWNLQAEKTLGWTAREAIGEDVGALIVPAAHREAHGLGFARFLSTGTGPVINQRIEVAAIHKDGREIPVELSVAPFRSDDGFGASAFMRDLTAVKAVQQKAQEHARELEIARAALVQSQKLEAVGKLTGGIAHDFNNVLQVVQGSLQLLQLENSTNTCAQKRIATAMTAVDRGAKLAAQLLAFARKQPLQPKVVNVAEVVHGMGDMLPRALGDAVQVEVTTGPSLWNTLVDPNQLENVVLNLCINARDAMKGEGKLTISVTNVALAEKDLQAEPDWQAGEFVVLAISDTGPGIPASIIERVFEPFFTTKPEGEGTGLGLSMAHGFVKQSGGHIRILSEIGHSTTVQIFLPRSHEPKELRLPPRPSTATGGDETILVVEDDPAVRETVVDMLRGLGYNVLSNSSAEDALERLRRDRAVDLLFTDVVMPGTLRSPDLARQAKQWIPTLQVLFTSGYTQDAFVNHGRLEPGVHLLSKPYGRDQLATKVRELLSYPVEETGIGDTGAVAEDSTKTLPRVAIVEDSDDFRAAMAEMLMMMHYQVEGFASAEAALARLQEGEFDVLLTDVSLPGMNGLELASAVSAKHPGIRIILASGHGSSVSNDARFPCQILAKPFSMEQLLRCLSG